MSDFEGSDLTDLEDEESYEPASTQSQKKKKKADQSDSYRIQGALKPPRNTNLSTQALHEQLVSNDISLEADYQRDVVWPVTKQIGLIDSLFRNFYVPPVIFAVTESPDGTQKRVCIDGKQRLTSIWRFMEGLIPYKDIYTNEKFFYKDLPERTEKGKLLPERYRKTFRNKQIVCMEYTDLSNSNEREVFQRVQLGMALTPAEKLQAIHSDVSTFVREIQHEYVDDRLADHLEWETARGTDFRCLCTAIYVLNKEVQTAPGVSSLQKWLQDSEEFDDDFTSSVHQTFKIFVWLSEDKDASKCFKIEKDRKIMKVSPAEFITTVVLIHRHKSKLTLKQLSEAIRKMRLDVRKSEVDVRLNSRCMKIMLSFISNLRPSILKEDSGHSVSSVAIKKLFKEKPKVEENSGDEEPETISPKKIVSKRKRVDEDEDADWEPKKPSASSQRATPSRFSVNRTSIKQPSSNAAEQHTPNYPTQPSADSIPFTMPPPISTLPAPPSAPRMHPDRLAALHAAKTGTPLPQYTPPQPIPYSSATSDPNGTAPLPHSPLPYQQRWNESPLIRMGPVISGGAPDVGPPPYSSDPTNVAVPRNDDQYGPNAVYSQPIQPMTGPYPNHRRDEYYDRNGYGRRYSGPRY